MGTNKGIWGNDENLWSFGLIKGIGWNSENLGGMWGSKQKFEVFCFSFTVINIDSFSKRLCLFGFFYVLCRFLVPQIGFILQSLQEHQICEEFHHTGLFVRFNSICIHYQISYESIYYLCMVIYDIFMAIYPNRNCFLALIVFSGGCVLF